MRVSLQDIEVQSLAGATVILDVDGTLTHDRGEDISDAALKKVHELAGVCDLYLVSNSTENARVHTIAQRVHARVLESEFRKPRAAALGVLNEKKGRRVVIGDKMLTDGLFARNICAEFIHTKRACHTNDLAHIRVIYFLDDLYVLAEGVALTLVSFLRLMRPHQWIKNALVFMPLFFAGAFFDFNKLLATLAVFVAFCAVASAVYVFNDIHDVAQDRAHPTKRNRPIASGAVSRAGAYGLLSALAALSAFLLSVIPSAIPALVLYALLNGAYSLWLKHVAVLDIALIATFYSLRLVAGGEASDVFVSPWIILCTFFGALVLISGKRLAEFRRPQRRAVLEGYSEDALKLFVGGASVLAILAYALWSVIAAPTPLMVYSVVFVVVALFRVVNIVVTKTEEAEYPEFLVFKDRVVVSMVILWALYVGVLFYLV